MKVQKSHIQTFKKSPHHHTPGSQKKAVVNQECKVFAKMKRFGNNIGSNDSKELFLEKLQNSLTAGASMNKDIFVGFNSVMKRLEKKLIAAVVIAKDSNSNITNCLLEVCVLHGIPFVLLPNISEGMKALLKVKSFTCCGIRNEKSSSDAVGEEESLELASKQAKLDELCDFIKSSQ